MKNKTDVKIEKKDKLSKEKYSDRAALITALTILYALLLLFLQRMSLSASTVLGAQAFIRILFWGSIVGAMLCAAWGAYKERPGMFTYCGVFVYILISMTVIQYCGQMGTDKAYALVYVSLFTAFVLCQFYFAMRGAGRLESKSAKITFAVVSVILFVLFAVAAVALKTRFFGLA